MKFFVFFSTLLCFFITKAYAITTTVDAGTTVNGGDVLSIITQNVYGTVKDMTVYGTQNIMSGGNAHNTIIYTYGQQVVNSGGISENATIMQSGVLKVYGSTLSTMLNSYGSMTVYSGAATQTTINGGTLYVRSGAAANNTLLNSGKQYVYGTDNSAEINGGTQIVTNSGIANDTIINTNGYQEVDAGSSAVGTYIEGGKQNVYGTVENSVLNSGQQNVFSDAAANNLTVNGGRLTINESATVDTLTLNGGTTNIYGGAVLNGQITVRNSTVNLYSNVAISDLMLDNGIVNVKTSSVNIPIDTLNGSGIFYLTTTVSENISDVLSVTNGSGSYGIALYDYSPSEEFPNTLTLVNTDNPDQNFYLIGGAADIGAYRYDLVHVGDTWQLQKTPYLNDGSIVAKNTFTAISSVFYSHLHGLGRHFDEIDFTKKTGFWVRGIGREIRLNFQDDTKSHLNVRGTQVGFDIPIKQKLFEEMIAGIYWGYSSSKQKFINSGKANSQTNSIGIYTTAKTQKEYFFSLEGVFYHHRQKIFSQLANGFQVNSKYSMDAWSFSGSFGKRFSKNGWFVKPQIQAYYMRLPDVFYTTDANTPVDSDNTDSIMGRISIKGGKNFKESHQIPLEAYLRLGILREFNKKSSVSFANYDFVESMTETLYEAGIGLSAEFNEKFSLFADFNTFWGNKTDIPVDVSFGAKILW